MKTTLELPDKLMKQVKLRAVHQGMKLKDTVADLLRKGLAAESTETLDPARIVKDKKTGLPVILTKHAAPRGEELTPERVAEILLEQEVEWLHDASR